MGNCLVVTVLPCDTPYPWKESPNGCAECGMMEWLSVFETEDECNNAFMKQYPELFVNGKYVGNKK